MTTTLITGASSGIGRALALECARSGHDLVLAARRLDRLEEVGALCRERGVKVHLLPLDVRDLPALKVGIEEAWERMGGIENVIANAGMGVFGPFAGMDLDAMKTMIQTNVSGVANLFSVLLPRLLERGSGHLTAIASVAGKMGYPNMALYSATKFAVVGLMEALSMELRGSGVGVTVICPGEVETEFFTHTDHDAMPGAASLIRILKAGEVARATLRAIRRKRFCVVIPWTLRWYLRFHSLIPGLSRFLFVFTSRIFERRKG